MYLNILEPVHFKKKYIYNIRDNLNTLYNVLELRILYFHDILEISRLILLSYYIMIWNPFGLLLVIDWIVVIFYPTLIVSKSNNDEYVSLEFVTDKDNKVRYVYNNKFEIKRDHKIDPNLLTLALSDYIQKDGKVNKLQAKYLEYYLK